MCINAVFWISSHDLYSVWTNDATASIRWKFHIIPFHANKRIGIDVPAMTGLMRVHGFMISFLIVMAPGSIENIYDMISTIFGSKCKYVQRYANQRDCIKYFFNFHNFSRVVVEVNF